MGGTHTHPPCLPVRYLCASCAPFRAPRRQLNCGRLQKGAEITGLQNAGCSLWPTVRPPACLPACLPASREVVRCSGSPRIPMRCSACVRCGASLRRAREGGACLACSCKCCPAVFACRDRTPLPPSRRRSRLPRRRSGAAAAAPRRRHRDGGQPERLPGQERLDHSVLHGRHQGAVIAQQHARAPLTTTPASARIPIIEIKVSGMPKT